MADFTTWTAFETAVLNDISNRVPGIKSYRTPDGTFVEARTPDEMEKLLSLAADKKAIADASTGVATRRSHAI